MRLLICHPECTRGNFAPLPTPQLADALPSCMPYQRQLRQALPKLAMRAILGTSTVQLLCLGMAVFNNAVQSFVYGVGCGTSITSNHVCNSNLKKPLLGIARLARHCLCQEAFSMQAWLTERVLVAHPVPMKIKPDRPPPISKSGLECTSLRQRGRYWNRAVVSIDRTVVLIARCTHATVICKPLYISIGTC